MDLETLGLEKIAFIRPDGGRLGITSITVTVEHADRIVEELVNAADASGEVVMILRARGERLIPVDVTVPPADADRIVADAFRDRDL